MSKKSAAPSEINRIENHWKSRGAVSNYTVKANRLHNMPAFTATGPYKCAFLCNRLMEAWMPGQ